MLFAGTEFSRMLCCGKAVCKGCHEQVQTFKMEQIKRTRRVAEETCPMCRTALPTNTKQGAKMVRKHAENGKPWAQNNLAHRLLHGRGVHKSPDSALAWYTKAAEAGHPTAQADLGGLLIQAKDYINAQGWLTKSAMQRHAIGLYNLGMLYSTVYEEGKGVIEQCDKKALELWRLSVDQGYESAQLAIGHMYENGISVLTSHQKAKEFYTCAAKQGSVEGQYNLARVHMMQGEIVPCLFWCRKAAATGDEDSIDMCEQLEAALQRGCAPCKVQSPVPLVQRCSGCKAACYCNTDK